jgi:thymidylate synthase
MIFLKGTSISELYPALLQRVLEEGDEVAPRGMPTLEVAPLGFELTDPRQSLVLQKARRLNYAYAIVERLSLVSGTADADMLCFYIDKLRDYLNPETRCFDGAYGPRVRPQLDYVYEELQRDPASRRAVISIYSEADQRESLDVPCTLALHFLIRHGKLDLMVNMRSSDLFLGLPYDVSQFAFLQQVVAGWLSIEPGRYIQWAHSAHIYGQHVERVKRVLCSADDCSEMRLAVPNLSRKETFRQIRAVLNIERDARTRPNGETPGDPRGTSLSPEFRHYAEYLSRYLEKKSAVSEKRGLAATRS